MYDLIIENYVKNLTPNDVYLVATKNNIILNDKEFDYVFKTIKNNYKFLLGEDYMLIFDEAKKFLRSENYDKILALYLDYREKYKDIVNEILSNDQ